MSFFKDLLKMLAGSKKHGYRKYSSSDDYRRSHRPHDYGRSHYGHSHYKKRKYSSGSFFSS
ncbi:hypothetical protein JQN58_11540 [Aneurinibacillus sp. BA2021]|nr:hypothetical protein [Aneurinibacillus sp. BA2021]